MDLGIALSDNLPRTRCCLVLFADGTVLSIGCVAQVSIGVIQEKDSMIHIHTTFDVRIKSLTRKRITNLTRKRVSPPTPSMHVNTACPFSTLRTHFTAKIGWIRQ